MQNVQLAAERGNEFPSMIQLAPARGRDPYLTTCRSQARDSGPYSLRLLGGGLRVRVAGVVLELGACRPSVSIRLEGGSCGLVELRTGHHGVLRVVDSVEDDEACKGLALQSFPPC